MSLSVASGLSRVWSTSAATFVAASSCALLKRFLGAAGVAPRRHQRVVVDLGPPWLEVPAGLAGLAEFGEFPVADELCRTFRAYRRQAKAPAPLATRPPRCSTVATRATPAAPQSVGYTRRLDRSPHFAHSTWSTYGGAGTGSALAAGAKARGTRHRRRHSRDETQIAHRRLTGLPLDLQDLRPHVHEIDTRRDRSDRDGENGNPGKAGEQAEGARTADDQ